MVDPLFSEHSQVRTTAATAVSNGSVEALEGRLWSVGRHPARFIDRCSPLFHPRRIRLQSSTQPVTRRSAVL
jgi:hypothetical protein